MSNEKRLSILFIWDVLGWLHGVTEEPAAVEADANSHSLSLANLTGVEVMLWLYFEAKEKKISFDITNLSLVYAKLLISSQVFKI